jgi:hypothetical protein
MAKETVTEPKQGTERRPLCDAEAAGAADGAAAAPGETSEALHGLRGAVDRASHGLRDLGRAGEHWAEERALELGRGLRGQGERVVGGLARQVEHNPLTSVAIAFTLGVLCTLAARR